MQEEVAAHVQHVLSTALFCDYEGDAMSSLVI